MFRKNSFLYQLLFAVLVFGALHYFLKVSNLEGLTNKDTLRYFYMNGCPHCVKFTPEWENFVNQCGTSCKTTNEKVESESMQEQHKQHVQGFPTIVLFDSSDQKKKVFEGERTAAGLKEFVESHAA